MRNSSPKLTRIALAIAGLFCCSVNPLMAQTVIIGDAGVEVVDVPPTILGTIDTLVLGNTATGDGTLNFSGGTLDINHAGGYSGYLTVGNSGIGTFNHSNADGDAVINITGPQYVGPAPGDLPDPWGGYLFVGRNDGSAGQYSMTDSQPGNALTLNVQNQIQIGGSNVSTEVGGGLTCTIGCTGSFVQSGGVVTAEAITIGIGTYNLQGGDLNVTGNGIGSGTIVGTYGTGALFNQSGGTHTTGTLTVGERSDSSATYVLSDGDLVVNGQMFVGLGHDALPASGQVNGLFQQMAGSVTAAQIFVGGYTEVIFDSNDPNSPPTIVSHLGTGHYEISDGTVTSGFTVIGKSGNGTVTQTGGTFDAGILHLGDDGLFSSSNGNGVSTSIAMAPTI
jgi:hypothetical protein